MFCLFWGIGRGFGAPPIPPHSTSNLNAHYYHHQNPFGSMEPTTRFQFFHFASEWHVPRRLRSSSRVCLGSSCKMMDVSDRHCLRWIESARHSIFLFPSFVYYFFSLLFSNHSDLFLLLFHSSLDKRRDGKSVAGNQFTLPGRERN